MADYYVEITRFAWYSHCCIAAYLFGDEYQLEKEKSEKHFAQQVRQLQENSKEIMCTGIIISDLLRKNVRKLA